MLRQKSKVGLTPLIVAARNLNLQAVSLIYESISLEDPVERQRVLDMTDVDGNTAAHHLAVAAPTSKQRGDTLPWDVVLATSQNIKNNVGETLILRALNHGNIKLVVELLQSGGVPSSELTNTDKKGNTLLHVVQTLVATSLGVVSNTPGYSGTWTHVHSSFSRSNRNLTVRSAGSAQSHARAYCDQPLPSTGQVELFLKADSWTNSDSNKTTGDNPHNPR